MKLRYTLLILLMIPFMLFGQQKEDAMIYGKIIDDSGNAVELVNVAVMGTSYGTSSNARGQYELSLPSDTNLEIVFSFVGYKQETRNIKLKKGEERKIDVIMEYTSVTLPDAVISDRKINSATITRIDARKVTFVPSSGAGGVEDLVKTLPGVSSTNELSSQYNVRGGSFDENSVYIIINSETKQIIEIYDTIEQIKLEYNKHKSNDVIVLRWFVNKNEYQDITKNLKS